jgi:asparagine synthase (glutamine-hydrolysing)
MLLSGAGPIVSGFIVVLDFDGAPVDAAQLRACLDVAPFGQDCDIWVDGPVVLAGSPFRQSGHGRTLRARGLDAEGSLVVDRDLAIVFDGRLDDRANMCARLTADLGRECTNVTDAQLIGAAYSIWGAAAPEHLLGDFAFCLWDRRRQELIAARDHFGVKPLYVARCGRTLIVSNVLRAVTRHPLVSDRLDDLAVGDLLLFGLAMDPARTPFADVSRVPPGHVLECSRVAAVDRVRRYWTLEAGEPPYRRDEEAVEEFAAALRLAVADRLRGGPVGVLMSGGLDSTSVAAIAADVLGPSGSTALRAFTGVYESVPQDDERRYSTIVAAALKIGIEHLPLDRYTLFERWNADRLPPEPTTEPMTAVTADLLAQAASHGAAVLTGDGGDPLLLPSTLVSQIGHVPFFDLLAGFWRSLAAHDRPPLGIRSAVRHWLRRASDDVPPWLGDALVRSFDPIERWLHVRGTRAEQRGARTAAINRLLDPWWPSMFETYDPGATGQPVAMRYPFWDRRVVRVALRLPSFPLCANKQVLRRAVRGKLPDAVRLRPKTPLAVAPESFHAPWSVADAVRAIAMVPDMTRYVDVQKFESTVRQHDLFTDRAPGTLAAVCLAMWLRYSSNVVVHT